MLSLLVLLPLIWWRWLVRQPHSAVRFSSISWLKHQGGSFRVKSRHILPMLRTMSVGLLIVCLARPQKGNEETRIFSEGVAIQMVVDRSSSMQAMDFNVGGRPVDRLTAVKKVFEEFVMGDEGLGGRPDDLIGMVTFAGYADGQCPLTLDHAYLVSTLSQIEIVGERSEDGTAIGDAIALAVLRLGDLDRKRGVLEANKIKSKIIILLTDGESNRGEIPPAKAAELAATDGIKIYTIGAGTTGIAQIPVPGPFGDTVLQRIRVTVDEETLKQIASTTGGRFWRATDTDSLREIYAEIDLLEKTETEEKRYMQYAEIATEGLDLGWVNVPPILVIVLIAVALEILLANTRFRKIP